MNKRWYSVAFSITVIGCGGDVDDGKPSATGGTPTYHYGPAQIVGGATSVAAKATGGVSAQPTGGSSSIDAGTPSTGGFSPIIMYMANLRLPPKDATGKHHYALTFEPRPQRDPA